MAVTDDASAPARHEPSTLRSAPLLVLVAGCASLGAGAVHAVAAGAHSEHSETVAAFTAIAVLQLVWGAAILARPWRWLAVAGAAVNALALGGWLTAKISGIPGIEGLDESEPIDWSDGLAAFLAAVAVVAILRALLGVRTDTARPAPAAGAFVAVVAVGALALPSMIATASHTHAGAGHEHGDGDVAAGHDDAGDHDDAADHAAHEDGAVASDDHADHEDAAVPAKPYDPELPIDLSGMEGVTPRQQARAENLIAITLARLPQFSDPAAAEAAGFHSIGDSFTGYEHFINWSYIDDGHVLNPDYPESLVYSTASGQRELVSAMFMLPRGSTLDDVPNVGGKLTQWHVHDDLCFTDDPVAPQVRGVTSVGGPCSPPLVKLDPVPMIHVWIVPHQCGPFAALEGVGAGQIEEGEERLCDHAHGSGTSLF
jgi:hypothetical protein